MFLRKLFGGDENKIGKRKPVETKTNAIDTLSKLKKTTETLEKRKDYLSIKIGEFMKKAMEKNKKGDKRAAMLFLKKRKCMKKKF